MSAEKADTQIKYGWEYLSLDTLTTLEVRVDPPSPPYPAMVTVELDGATLLAEDVREMARIFSLAAAAADRMNADR